MSFGPSRSVPRPIHHLSILLVNPEKPRLKFPQPFHSKKHYFDGGNGSSPSIDGAVNNGSRIRDRNDIIVAKLNKVSQLPSVSGVQSAGDIKEEYNKNLTKRNEPNCEENNNRGNSLEIWDIEGARSKQLERQARLKSIEQRRRKVRSHTQGHMPNGYELNAASIGQLDRSRQLIGQMPAGMRYNPFESHRDMLDVLVQRKLGPNTPSVRQMVAQSEVRSNKQRLATQVVDSVLPQASPSQPRLMAYPQSLNANYEQSHLYPYPQSPIASIHGTNPLKKKMPSLWSPTYLSHWSPVGPVGRNQ